MRRFGSTLLALALGVCFWGAWRNPASAVQIWLKDGRILEGKWAPVEGLTAVPKPPAPDGTGPVRLVGMVDDDLRRTFFPKRQIENFGQESSDEIFEKYRLRQRVIHVGPTIKSVGPFFPVGQFDEYGRRRIKMHTVRGTIDVIQCITEITPLWTKVEGRTHVWDMRISTNSIPIDVLAKILARLTPSDDVEAREKLARFYLQSERYGQSYQTLEKILADFPNDADLRKRLEPIIQAIRQRRARQLLDELKLRQQAGQLRFVEESLKVFPSEGVAGDILEDVRQMVHECASQEAQRKELLERLDELLGKIEEEAVRERIAPIRDEIRAELNANTLARLAAFRLMLDDESQPPESKLALAISGWLLGGKSATERLPVALSAWEVRALVREYLNARDKMGRARILERFYAQEGGTPRLVAKLLAHMKPPIETSPPRVELPREGEPPAGVPPADDAPGTDSQEATPPRPPARPGFYELEVPGLGSAPPVRYLVQLPPEYDPYRRYPAVVTLHGASTTPAQQIGWWAGDWTIGGWRNGQASRHGYVVIAPAWSVEHQKSYRYSAQEHAAVLDCLRDACRRFAIDTDRVFLSGHSMGGDAAWDLGLAHPDLWAGVIPIVARTDKYCSRYWENASMVPFYFVCGQLDGDKMVTNARDLDRYLTDNFRVTVVEYRGRGHEHFSDEIQRLFDWMGRFRRDFFPKEFTARSMRYWDNFFWWVELDALPPKTMVDPVDWPPPRGRSPMVTRAFTTAKNGLNVRTGAGIVRVWLSPDMLDLGERVDIEVNGRRIVPMSQLIEPDLETLLEDVRTRGDRQHPFWLKLESGAPRTGRR